MIETPFHGQPTEGAEIKLILAYSPANRLGASAALRKPLLFLWELCG